MMVASLDQLILLGGCIVLNVPLRTCFGYVFCVEWTGMFVLLGELFCSQSECANMRFCGSVQIGSAVAISGDVGVRL